MKLPLALSAFVLFALVSHLQPAAAANAGVVYEGTGGPGKGKHIVFISGDEEYRSEEALPQLAKILAEHHGFKCTVLFAIDPKTGTINPDASNIPGTEALKTADLMVIFTRFRHLPEEQMQPIADYIESGKPIIGIRTATHAFAGNSGKFAKYDHNHKGKEGDKDWTGGFGKQVLGETWVAHHGGHGKQSTRGIPEFGQESHPILKGIAPDTIWGTTDVYTVNVPLAGDSQPLVLGAVLEGMNMDDKPVEGKLNNPMMPVAWTKTYAGDAGKTARIFTTTMGSSEDLTAEGTRRMLVNAAYWCQRMEDQIPAKSNVEIVGDYKPNPFRGGGFTKDVKPEDLQWKK